MVRSTSPRDMAGGGAETTHRLPLYCLASSTRARSTSPRTTSTTMTMGLA